MTRTGTRLTASGITALLLAFCGPAPGWAAAAPTPAPPPTWQPPPVDMSLVAPDSAPTPPQRYVKKYGCLASDTSGAVLTTEPPAQAMLDIADAQKISTGKGVTVAVIDTGVNKQSFLTGRLTGGGDYVDPSTTNNGTVDCDGHGTITAGIVAADTRGTGFGFTGVASDANILAIRQSSTAYLTLTSGGTPTGAGDTASLAQAIRHAVDAGARVITTSVDECIPVTDPAQPIQLSPADRELQATVHYAVQHNVVVVNSAGNINSGKCQKTHQNSDPDPNLVNQIQVPAVFADDVLSVASVAPATGAVSSFSVWGPWVSVAAPGEGIVSVDPEAGRSGLANLYAEPGASRPNAIEGTSFAAPYVAGLAALLRAKYPTMTAREIMYRIESTARHPSAPGGRDNQVGYGVIDPVAALTASIPSQNGVPRPTTTSIKAPSVSPGNPLPIRVAVIGAGIAVVLLVAVFFLVRTRRSEKDS
ncbi:MAG TPA: type VII secretion-associated serine protease mycosin [Pseudonocardiaceae bacterium]